MGHDGDFLSLPAGTKGALVQNVVPKSPAAKAGVQAGDVVTALNGKPIGSAGPKGQVRNVQFTSGGFQIESPKPAVAAPLDPLDR